MNIRRRVDLRAVVIETDVIEDRRLSAAALGVYGYLAAGADDAQARSSILRRFRMTAAQLDACLDELRAAGHLVEAPAPLPRRSSAPRSRAIQSPLTQSGRLLLQVLARKADPAGCIALLNRELTAETGQHLRTVHRNLAALEAGGFLRREIAPDGVDGNTQRRIHLVTDPPEHTPQVAGTITGSTLQ